MSNIPLNFAVSKNFGTPRIETKAGPTKALMFMFMLVLVMIGSYALPTLHFAMKPMKPLEGANTLNRNETRLHPLLRARKDFDYAELEVLYPNWEKNTNSKNSMLRDLVALTSQLATETELSR